MNTLPARFNLPLFLTTFPPYLNPPPWRDCYALWSLRLRARFCRPPFKSQTSCLCICAFTLSFVSPSSVFDKWRCSAELQALHWAISGDRNQVAASTYFMITQIAEKWNKLVMSLRISYLFYTFIHTCMCVTCRFMLRLTLTLKLVHACVQ